MFGGDRDEQDVGEIDERLEEAECASALRTSLSFIFVARFGELCG
jgi:hypothetical protein